MVSGAQVCELAARVGHKLCAVERHLITAGVDLAAGAVDVKGVKMVATKVEGAHAGALRSASIS